MRCPTVLVGLVLVLGLATGATAQTTQGNQLPSVRFRGFADIGAVKFNADESVKAVLGTSSGVVYGGGVLVELPSSLFAGIRASVFKGEGQRVYVFNGEVFPLDVDTEVSIVPIEVFAGYRFATGSRFSPYAGGGLGWHHYKETSAFATGDENVDEVFMGYQVMGGLEVRLARLFAVAGEVQWTSIPDQVDQGSTSVRVPFNESNLGGTAIRVKFVVGR